MANAKIVLTPNTPTKVGKGCRMMFTDKPTTIQIPAGRVLMSYALGEKPVQPEAKSGKDYMVNVSRIPVEIQKIVYDMNLQAMRNNGQKPDKIVKKDEIVTLHM